MNSDPRLIRGVLRCYPSGWRRRYGPEFAELLHDMLAEARGARRPALVLNAVRGALDARLTSLGGAVMSSRSPLTVAIWSAAIFTVAGLGFQKLTEDPSVMSAGNQHGLSAMFAVLVSAAAIALAAMVAVAVPAAVAMVRGRGKGTWWLLAVPPAAILIWYGILQLAFVIAGHRQLDSARNISAVILVIVAGLGVVATTAWAADTTLRRVGATGPRRLRPVAMTILAVGMAASTIACLTWGLLVRSAHLPGVAAHDGILNSPFLGSWLVVLAMMAAATSLAVVATGKQVRSAAA